MGFINRLAYILVIIGGLNWGLVGIGGFDLVAFIFGTLGIFSRTVYCLIGLSALWLILAPFVSERDRV